MDRWQKTRELFERAREMAPAEREKFLQGECHDDPALVEEVHSLLGHHSDGFLEDPRHLRERVNRGATGQPSQIGPYRILDELGSGGMGVVYLAEQQRPVARKVALKVIHPGTITKQVLARFDAERQALALMNHASIARVYDAGATEQGSPYFVMEYVQGAPITEHCDLRRLGIRERLALFIEVCDGVQHAHQKGIIHRDIKSSNILVAMQNDRAVPKIIDFGISKAIDQQLSEATAHTEIGQIVGTPEYMSPEQAEMTGRDIDTRSDIYSLGVLLYVLLVGEYPFGPDELRGVSFDELRRKIREDNPPRPSTRFTGLGERQGAISRERKTDPGSFVRELRGDLDWIVMKALDKDRARRYASAADFAADIRRDLNDEPVTARPPGAAYRVGKFVRRHRFGVAAAVVVAAALVLGVVGTTVGMLRARTAQHAATTEAATNEQVVGYLLDIFENADPEAASLGDVTAAEILEAGGAKIDSLAGQPRVQARLAREIGRIYAVKGDRATARPLLERSLEINRGIYGTDHLEVLQSITQLANLEARSHNYERACELHGEALPIAEKIFGVDGEEVAAGLKNLGDCLRRQQDYGGARRLHERALAIREKTGSPKIGQSLASLAAILVQLEDYDQAIPLLERSLVARREAYPSGHYRIGLGHFFLAEALDEAGRLDEARAHYKDALEIYAVTLKPGHEYTRNAAFGLAGALAAAGEHEQAEPQYARSLAIDEDLYGPDHEYLVETLEEYAACARSLGRTAEASELDERAARIREATEGAHTAPADQNW